MNRVTTRIPIFLLLPKMTMAPLFTVNALQLRHVEESRAARDCVDQGGEGRTGGQHRARDRTEHSAGDIHGEACSNHHQQVLSGSGRKEADGENKQDDRRLENGSVRAVRIEDTVPAHDEVQEEQLRREVAVPVLRGCDNENERDHGERSRWKRKSMDIPGLARR